jgi:hypothetical protein
MLKFLALQGAPYIYDISRLKVKPSTYDSLWLIVGRHYSHAKNLDMVDKTRKHSVAIVSLPPRQWLKICKSSRSPTHSLSNSKIFCSHKLSQITNSELYKAINSFSFQTAVARVSREESLVVVKETSNKNVFLKQRTKCLLNA